LSRPIANKCFKAAGGEKGKQKTKLGFRRKSEGRKGKRTRKRGVRKEQLQAIGAKKKTRKKTS